MIYDLLGQNNFATSVFLDSICSLGGGDDHVIVVANIDEEENSSLQFSADQTLVKVSYTHSSSWRRRSNSRLLLGSIGRSRRAIFQDFVDNHKVIPSQFENLFDARANIPHTLKAGHGIYVAPGATIAPHVRIGNFTVVNRNSSVGHHTVLGNFVTINPGVTICGVCNIADNVIIGAGATIVDSINIGSNSIVGAGSLVRKEIPPNVVVAGNPAQVLRGV